MILPPKEVVKPKRKRGLVRGVGINDADYNVCEHIVVDGKCKTITKCPFYRVWTSILERCYSDKFHQTNPTYRDCKVCDEWLIFSNFKRWMETQDWRGKHLDKDLLVEGNKVYSPDTCIFVNQIINSFVTDRKNDRGQYMIGVNWHKRTGKFVSQCSNPFIGRQEHLGLFTNELDAHLAWKARKHELACILADSEYCNDPRLAQVLRTKYLGDFTNA